jgi:hypothetical protein
MFVLRDEPHTWSVCTRDGGEELACVPHFQDGNAGGDRVRDGLQDGFHDDPHGIPGWM